MRKTLVLAVVAGLVALAAPPPPVTAAAARESRILYSACPGTYANDECTRNGNPARTDIHSILPSGDGVKQITHNALYEQDVLLTRTGEEVVFEKSNEIITCNYNSSLARMEVDGTGSADSITKSGSYRCDEPTDYSPVAERFLFTREANVCMDVMVVNRDSSGRKQLTHLCDRNDPDEYAFDGNWARDGSRIIYRKNGYPNSEDGIYIMRANGSNKHKVRLGGRNVGDVDVSPGGHTLAFAVFGGGSPSLYTSNLNGDNVQRIYGPEGIVGIDHIRWSPDGKKILFVGQEGNGLGSLYVVGRDRSNPRKLDSAELDAVSTREIYGGYWSPDSTRVTFVVEDEDFSSHAVAVMDADGSDLDVLTGYEEGLYVWGWERLP